MAFRSRSLLSAVASCAVADQAHSTLPFALDLIHDKGCHPKTKGAEEASKTATREGVPRIVRSIATAVEPGRCVVLVPRL